jgi:hypothetical protein
MISPSGGKPLAGLSAARGLACGHPQGIFGAFSYYRLVMGFFQHGLPDRGNRHLEMNTSRATVAGT